MKIMRISEPEILFGHGQPMEDPRDGLTLFGPLDGREQGIRWGIIGTKRTADRFEAWVQKIQGPVMPRVIERSAVYPGFEAAFRVPWSERPAIRRVIEEKRLEQALAIDEPHQRVFAVVELFAAAIVDAQRTEDAAVDLWFVVIPDEVKTFCRPLSKVPRGQQIRAPVHLTRAQVSDRVAMPSLFREFNEEVVPYQYDAHFHNQLKAKLLERRIIVQVVLESTIAYEQVTKSNGRPLRDYSRIQSQIAWNLSTATFFKAGFRPWKLNGVRPGVCYVGLAFKVYDKGRRAETACCAAQMFMDSGDGFVFRGAVGPWYNPAAGDFHLRRVAADELVTMAVNTYKERNKGAAPTELFIHSKTRFSSEEWEGFCAGAGRGTRVVGVQIHDDRALKVFRSGDMPVIRGTAIVVDDWEGYLWTRGFVPRLQTYDGLETPCPLRVRISRGKADIETVLRDVFALTKVNYNSCRFGDGQPVTLRFADAIGEILTAGPIEVSAPLPFKFYL